MNRKVTIIVLLAAIAGVVIFRQSERIVSAARGQSLAYVHLERLIEPDEVGVEQPVGLAYDPVADALLIVDGAAADGATWVAPNGLRHAGSVSLPFGVPGEYLSFNPVDGLLYYYDESASELVALSASPQGAATIVERSDLSSLGLNQAGGLTFNPTNGALTVLESGANRLTTIAPDMWGSFNGQEALASGRVTRLDLGHLGAGQLRGAAHDPATGHLYVLQPSGRRMFKVDQAGQLAATYDLSGMELVEPGAMVVAPSSDQTDDPAAMDLYIVDDGRSAGQTIAEPSIVELSFRESVVTVFAQNNLNATLIRTIETSEWPSPSSDPAGLTWLPYNDKLLVSDSEINEMDLYSGANLFESTTAGVQGAIYTTLDYSNEPTGLDYVEANGHLFVSDDTGTPRVAYEIDPGPDGDLHTGDDIVTEIDVSSYGSGDPEGIAYGGGLLFIIDGGDDEVYMVDPGNNGVFDGANPVGDDSVTSFDTKVMGAEDPEGIDYHDAAGTIFIVSHKGEVVLEIDYQTATIINSFDISSLGAKLEAAVLLAPGSTNPNEMNLYIAARNVDNNVDPRENDGQIFEIAYEGATGPAPTPTSTPTVGPTPTPTNTPTPTPSPTPLPTNSMHVGDMDAGRTLLSKGQWNAYATIYVHDVGHAAVADADVRGTWLSGGSGSASCTTDASGACTISANRIKGGEASFTVTSITHASLIYVSAANHDDDGDSDGTTLAIPKSGNQAPTAAFTDSCTLTDCVFNASDSRDADGTIVSYQWDFGEGPPGSGLNTDHSYLAEGTYQVTLIVTDNAGASDSETRAVTVSNTVLLAHVSAISASTSLTNGGKWNAVVTVTVHDDGHGPASGVTVDASWSAGDSGSGSCVTGSNGQCTITKTNISRNSASVTFTVDQIGGGGYTYQAGSNEITSLVIPKPS